MIGEFVPARKRFSPTEMLLLIGFDLRTGLALVADQAGNLTTMDVEGLSIDWHYDPGSGKWTPDFEEG